MQPLFDIESATGEQSREAIARQIVSILHGIRFGSIEIVIHDGRVVQIDKHEKFRLKSQPSAP